MAVPDRPHRLRWPGGLSARLLLLTALFVLLAQLFIVAPSLAGYQDTWLLQRVRLAEEASVAVEVAPAGVVSKGYTQQLLVGAGVKSVALQSGGIQRLLLAAPRMERAPEAIDLRDRNPADWLSAPFRTLAPGPPGMLRVVARPQFRAGDAIIIVVPQAPLRADLQGYLLGLLAASAAISLVAGVVVYLSLNALLVRPMQRITGAMEKFRADPEDPSARLALSGRRDEIGRAEAELIRMQDDLRAALQSRARLAALGEAVAKINHDLRNMLTSAQMVAERLAGSGDPGVTRALPRLERALDRALALAQNVLAYGRSEEPPPQPAPVALAAAIESAGEDAGLGAGAVALVLAVGPQFQVQADPEQLHRILLNLLRNAREAIESTGRAQGRVKVSATSEGGHARIRIADDGPGVPDRTRARLFKPFAASGRPGGAGLGLAIARELARGHGGDLELVETGPEGATFELRLPAAPQT